MGEAEWPRAALSDLAERHTKRSRLLTQNFRTHAPDFAELTRAHLASKVRTEYQDAMVLPDVIQAQQRTGIASLADRSKANPRSDILQDLEEQLGVKTKQNPRQGETSSAVALRPVAAAKAQPRSESVSYTHLTLPTTPYV